MMRAWALATAAGLALIVGCGASEATEPLRWTQAARANVLATPSVDPLLARARAGLRRGQLDPQTRRELLASQQPQHARARRVLLAFEAVPVAPQAPATDEFPNVPAFQLTTPPPDPKAPRSIPPTSSSSPTPRAVSRPRRSSSPAPALASATTLRGVGLRSTKSGASLTLEGTRGLVVGVANQPRSGIVRLVVEAGASARALSARPKIAGARVTGVRRTGRSVFITMALEPGWSLGGIVKTKGGARVNLRRSA